MKDKMGQNRGFGFVIFESDQIAEEFCNRHNGSDKLVLHDREIDFKAARPRTETKSYKSQSEDKQQLTRDDPAWGVGPAKVRCRLSFHFLQAVFPCSQVFTYVPGSALFTSVLPRASLNLISFTLAFRPCSKQYLT